jgi:serine/threonine protein kinase
VLLASVCIHFPIYFYRAKYCFSALFYIFSAGYVHRDISPGNIIIVFITNDGKETPSYRLADLEYARPYLRDENAKQDTTELRSSEKGNTDLAATLRLRAEKTV